MIAGAPGGGWTVERRPGGAGALHALPLPDPVTRTVWVCEPTAPALVLGSAQPEAHVDREACRRAGVEVVRRRSGGGAVLVAPGAQLWLDVLLPAGDELWSDDVGRAFHWVGEVWAAALADVGIAGAVHRGPLRAGPWSSHICFAGVGPGEVLDGAGRKVVGLSQRRTRAGARFQGTALARWEPAALVDLLALPPEGRAGAVAALRDGARGVGPDLAALEAAVLRHLP